MTLEKIKSNLKDYYDSCDHITFWFTLIVMTQLVGFIPALPNWSIYICFFAYSAYSLKNFNGNFCIPLLLFIFYIPLQLLLVEPHPMFKSWERYGLFTLLLICTSPLLDNGPVINNRRNIFKIAILICAFIGCSSFLCRFLGINYASMSITDYILSVGTFGGVTRHSMLLGPVSGIGAIYLVWLAYERHNYWYVFLALMCFGSVMFSASRSAFAATIAGEAIIIYKISDNRQSFVKIIFAILMIGSITYPLWENGLEMIRTKNELNISAGGLSSSRDALWTLAYLEFDKYPMLGVGFDAVDLELAQKFGGFMENTGMVEAGSSWLIIFSMTGLVGAVIMIPFLFTSYARVFKSDYSIDSLICSVLTLFYVHMIAEGYIYYGGSILAFLLWTTLGVAYDCRKTNDEIFE